MTASPMTLQTLKCLLASHLTTPVVLALAFSTTLLLSGCTGGHGGSSGLSGDQDADPVVLEIPIAYVSRPIPNTPIDYLDPNSFNPGARLLVRQRSSLSAPEFDVTGSILAIVAAELSVSTSELNIDIKDLDVSFDGSQLVFAARVVPNPVNANLENTTWNLWQMDFSTRRVSYVINSALKRNEGVAVGSSQDTAPHFLTDDRIAFTSTRQTTTQARQLNEGRAEIYSAIDEDMNNPASVLMIYDPQGGSNEFTQLSFNQSHDFDPATLANGQIIFSRWNNTLGRDHVSLYTISPTGRRLSNLYGYHSEDTGTSNSPVLYTQPRELPDGSIMALVKARNSTTFGGDIVVIDSANYSEINQPTWANQGLISGPAQRSLTGTNVTTDGSLSPGGYYASAYPLYDGTDRFLVSWSACRVIGNNNLAVPCNIGPANGTPAPPLYGVWVYDSVNDTQQPVVTARDGVLISEVVAGEPRQFPAIATDNNVDLTRTASEAHLLIDSVYDFDGVANTSTPASYLRIIQPVPIPTTDVFDVPNYAYGLSTNQSMREILGYVPVASDGSVSAVVPAESPVLISVVDSNARRISPRHNFMIQAGSQEVIHCVGCHTATSELPHGRIDSLPPSSNPSPLAASSISDIALDPYIFGALPTPGSVYTTEWTDIPAGREVIVPNFDPSLPSRIVINYVDHIQAIWDRTGRPTRLDRNAVPVDSCVACHSTVGETVVPAGQLDLTSTASDLNPDHFRSYQELLVTDNEQWVQGGTVADRTRTCTTTVNGVPVINPAVTIPIAPTMTIVGANASARFFNCMETGNCSTQGNPPLPANCTENTGTIELPTSNTVNHANLLTPAELRLISEWLDIGGQYYNNPFDSRLN